MRASQLGEVMIRSGQTPLVVALVLLTAFIGCARRPVTTQASAPSDIAMTAPPGGAGAPGIERTSPAGPNLGTAPSYGGGARRADASEGGSGPQGGATSGPQRRAASTTHRGASNDPAVGNPHVTRSAGTTARAERLGAGAAPRRALREFSETAALEDVYFEFDESTIPPTGIQALNANASWIKGHPDRMILIEGHCDDRGTNDYNLALGERRARSAMNYLVAHGVPNTRIVTVSYGEERPACRAPTESCWSKNRRAHFLVYAQ